MKQKKLKQTKRQCPARSKKLAPNEIKSPVAITEFKTNKTCIRMFSDMQFSGKLYNFIVFPDVFGGSVA